MHIAVKQSQHSVPQAKVAAAASLATKTPHILGATPIIQRQPGCVCDGGCPSCRAEEKNSVPAIQRQQMEEEEEVLQGKLESAQRQGAQDEEGDKNLEADETLQAKCTSGETQAQHSTDAGQAANRFGLPTPLQSGRSYRIA